MTNAAKLEKMFRAVLREERVKVLRKIRRERIATKRAFLAGV